MDRLDFLSEFSCRKYDAHTYTFFAVTFPMRCAMPQRASHQKTGNESAKKHMGILNHVRTRMNGEHSAHSASLDGLYSDFSLKL
jgi:hypothetical protein